ncbi:MAG: FMN-binding negative transcriptional regulator [Pseudomonadota bacterium]
MYLPKLFEENSLEVMQQLMRDRPLATVVTLSSQGLNANHIPLHLVAVEDSYGVLRGHVARSNSMWSDLQNSEVLAIFHGPESYVSPSWYATKKETSKVVPTWNYAVVHAHGTLNIIDDSAWIRTQMEVLTDQQEQTHPKPWAVTDAPNEYIQKMLEAVVGIEIKITKLLGKWKVSQNQPPQNQVGVIAGLDGLKAPEATAMADLMKQRQP